MKAYGYSSESEDDPLDKDVTDRKVSIASLKFDVLCSMGSWVKSMAMHGVS